MRARKQIGLCTICGKQKAAHEFSKDKRCKYGLRPECKVCEARRPSRILKNIRYRLKHTLNWYAGITCDLTKEQVASIPFVCWFCRQPIEEGLCLHRLDHTGNYTIGNVVYAHKSCHAKYGGHTTAKNPRKGFGAKNFL